MPASSRRLGELLRVPTPPAGPAWLLSAAERSDAAALGGAGSEQGHPRPSPATASAPVGQGAPRAPLGSANPITAGTPRPFSPAPAAGSATQPPTRALYARSCLQSSVLASSLTATA